MMFDEFGNKLSALREERKFSQDDLAFHLDVSRQTVSKWERGESVPSIRNIRKICEFFGVSQYYFYEAIALSDVPSDDEAEEEAQRAQKCFQIFSIVFFSIAAAVVLFVLISITLTCWPYPISENGARGGVTRFGWEFLLLMWTFVLSSVLGTLFYVLYRKKSKNER